MEAPEKEDVRYKEGEISHCQQQISGETRAECNIYFLSFLYSSGWRSEISAAEIDWMDEQEFIKYSQM